MTAKNTTVILARVSSKSQEDEGYSLDSQLKLLQGYCQNNDLRVVKVYKIAETASKEQSRKIFSELLSYLVKNDIYNLAVEKTDRLTRNLRDAVAIDDWLQGDKDRMLHAVKESLKLQKDSKSDVKFMWNIHLAVAKKYTDNLREEAMKGWAEKLAQGHMPSRPPAGYTTAMQSGKRIHVPDPKTSQIVKKAFELYLQPTESTSTIWAFLNQSGLRTYNGKPLSQSAVHRLLLNPYYMGVISFNNETYQGAHQPLITRQLYKQVQDKLHNKRPAKQRKHDIALRNILTCGHCNKTITWQAQKGHLYGTCQRDLPECKQNKMLREEQVHELLVSKLEGLISPSQDVFKWIIDRIVDEHAESDETTEQLKQSFRQRIARLENMAETLYDDKLAGEITKDRYEAKKATIQKQITDLRDELAMADSVVENKHDDAIEIMELTQTAKAQYLDAEMGHDAKRTILTKLFDSVTYANNSVSVKLSFLAESIGKRSAETRQIMETQRVLNQTVKSQQFNRDVLNKKDLKNEIFPVWQGRQDSNLQPTVLETATLPIELLPFSGISIPDNERRFPDKQAET